MVGMNALRESDGAGAASYPRDDLLQPSSSCVRNVLQNPPCRFSSFVFLRLLCELSETLKAPGTLESLQNVSHNLRPTEPLKPPNAPTSPVGNRKAPPLLQDPPPIPLVIPNFLEQDSVQERLFGRNQENQMEKLWGSETSRHTIRYLKVSPKEMRSKWQTRECPPKDLSKKLPQGLRKNTHMA